MTWIVQRERLGKQPEWLQESPEKTFHGWVPSLRDATRYGTCEEGKAALQRVQEREARSLDYLRDVTLLGDRESWECVTSRWDVERRGLSLVNEITAKVRKEGGFLQPRELDILVAFAPMTPLLVRCNQCRFVAAACYVDHICQAIEGWYTGDVVIARSLDYVRDVSLLGDTEPAEFVGV